MQGYGATPSHDNAVQAQVLPLKRRWNGGALWVSLLIPWFVFVGALAVLSFPMRYQNAVLGPAKVCGVVLVACLLVVLSFGYLAFEAWQKRQFGRGHREPTIHTFLFVTGLVAWMLALAIGDYNFELNVSPFNQLMNLNVYKEIDPAMSSGDRFMDAGSISFTHNTKPELSLSSGFRNGNMYCVAPLTSVKGNQAFYDFWAVGMDCCSDHAADFHCGEYENPKAKSGLRLLSVHQQEHYRLAVQQAEATYNILARHPIFVTWMEEPGTEIEQYQGDASKVFMLASVLYGLFQVSLVGAMVLVLTKLGW